MRTMPIARLDSRALIRVTGPDWRSFLQGLLTNDVDSLEDGGLRFAALLTPQGKLLFDLFVVGGSGGALLDVAADRRAALVQRLTLYKLRAKVEIAPAAEAVFAAWADALDGGMTDPRLAALGSRIYGEAALDVDEAAYEAHRLALGVPDPARDAIADKTYPIEANFDLLNGIDFQKGCFVGQETTSRMKRRGAIKNRMLPIAFEGPPPPFGAEILTEGQLRAGEVLTGRDGRAMALVRLDRVDGPLVVEGRPVRVEHPGWMSE